MRKKYKDPQPGKSQTMKEFGAPRDNGCLYKVSFPELKEFCGIKIIVRARGG